MSLQVAIQVPFKAGVDAPLHAGFVSSSAMVADHSRDKHVSKLVGQLQKARGDQISEFINALIRSAVVGDRDLLVDKSRDHVAAEAAYDTWKGYSFAVLLEGETFDQPDGAV